MRDEMPQQLTFSSWMRWRCVVNVRRVIILGGVGQFDYLKEQKNLNELVVMRGCNCPET